MGPKIHCVIINFKWVPKRREDEEKAVKLPEVDTFCLYDWWFLRG